MKCISVVTQEEYDEGPFTFDGTLDEVIASLVAIRESIPEEFRAVAECEIESEGGYEGAHHASIRIEYWRPETDEEVGVREDIDMRRLESDAYKARVAYECAVQRMNAKKNPA